MGLLIDTSVLIDLEGRGAALDDLGAAVRREPLAMSALSLGELLRGIARGTDEARRAVRTARISELLGGLPVVAFDATAAEAFARLDADLAVRGTPLPSLDSLIAAHAIARGDGVLTLDRRHFDRVPGLRVVAPAWHQ